MSRIIWKYPIQAAEKFTLKMPARAQVLAVQVQHGKPCLWALVEPNAPLEQRTFGIWGTGHLMPDIPLTHLGTFQLEGGFLIFHLFEYTY